MASARKPRAAHKLFVITEGPREFTEQTLAVLEFVKRVKPYLDRMDVAVEVVRVQARQMGDQRLVDAFRGKGITSFPALKTPNHIYAGTGDIARIYTRAIKEFQEYMRRGTAEEAAEYGGASAEDIYKEFIGKDIRAGSDWASGDDPIGETGDMMGRMQEMMRKRAEAAAKFKGNSGGGSGLAPVVENNVKSGDDPAIDKLINEIGAGPLTSETIDQAFKGEAPDDARDDVLMKAFWANQSSTM